MDNVNVIKVNQSFVQIQAEQSILHEINDRYTFFAPNYKFMPQYKHGTWDGKIRLLNGRNCQLPHGLFSDLKKFTQTNGYELTHDPEILPKEIDDETIEKFLTAVDVPFELRDYQRESFYRIAKNQRQLLISPTGSGKSLIIYLVMRWSLAMGYRTLLVCPTTSLVEQMYTDFEDYSKQNKWDVEKHCHRIYSGHDKKTDKDVVISTWQSIFNLAPSWFSGFQTAMVDEAHLAKAKSLNKIMNSCTNACIRVGTTGTLDGSQVNELVLTGLFGPVYKATTTKKLIDDDTLSKTHINVIRLEYSKEESKLFNKMVSKYPQEMAYLTQISARNTFLCKLALSQKKNTLLLFNYVENHGKPLFELLKTMNEDSNRKILFISGEIDTQYREEVRHIMEKEKDAVLVASMGTFSTGVNIKNLHNIIFASPTKSQIRVLQSIGRGLRKHGDNSTLKIFDVIDDLTGGRKKKNFALKHGIERMKIYVKEKFEYSVHDLTI